MYETVACMWRYLQHNVMHIYSEVSPTEFKETYSQISMHRIGAFSSSVIVCIVKLIACQILKPRN